MTNKTAGTLLNQIDALLCEERHALLHGDLEAIAPLLNRKEKLIEALNALEHGTQSDMVQLRDKVMHNQALLDGALQGIRAVSGRLAAFQKIRRSLDIYNRAGQKTAISDTVEHKVEKRA